MKVAVRVRPFNSREVQRNAKNIVEMQGTSTRVTNPTTGQSHTRIHTHTHTCAHTKRDRDRKREKGSDEKRKGRDDMKRSRSL